MARTVAKAITTKICLRIFIKTSGDKSIILDMLKSLRILNGFTQSITVLHVALKVTDARVEDVVERVLP